MDIKQSKSILARLLAKENLTVQHKNIPTAYFDTKNRLLALPIWKDMSTDLYDLLTGHEVGHALYTPTAGWHDQVQDKDFGDHFINFVNTYELVWGADQEILRIYMENISNDEVFYCGYDIRTNYIPRDDKNFFIGMQMDENDEPTKPSGVQCLNYINEINL